MKFGLSYSTGFAGTDPANLTAIARHRPAPPPPDPAFEVIFRDF